MDWGIGQKLLSMWGQRIKKHVSNTIIAYTCNPSSSLSRYVTENSSLFKMILIYFEVNRIEHFPSFQDMSHVVGKNRKELLAMAKGHSEDKKGLC
jgi:hypothetical protein